MSTQTHPMILVAASAVTVASLVAVASLTGLLPGSHNKETPPAVVASAPTEAVPPSPAAPPAAAPVEERSLPAHQAPASKATHRPAERKQAHASPPPARGDSREAQEGQGMVQGSNEPTARPAPPPAIQQPACRDCGTVESVRSVTPPAQGSGIGAIAGGVLGGLVGNRFGGGSGRDLTTVAGAVGGAFAGNEVEKRVRSESKTEVTIRFDDGSTRTMVLGNTSRWQRGDRVRVVDGHLEAN